MCNYTFPVTWACGHTIGTTEFDSLCNEQNDLRKQSLPFERCPPPKSPNKINNTELCWRCNDQLKWCAGSLPAEMLVGEASLKIIGPEATGKVMSTKREERIRQGKAKRLKEAEDAEKLERARAATEEHERRLDSMQERLMMEERQRQNIQEKETMDRLVNAHVLAEKEKEEKEKGKGKGKGKGKECQESLCGTEIGYSSDTEALAESSLDATVAERWREERKDHSAAKSLAAGFDPEIQLAWVAWEKSKGRSSPSAEDRYKEFNEVVQKAKKNPNSLVAKMAEKKRKEKEEIKAKEKEKAAIELKIKELKAKKLKIEELKIEMWKAEPPAPMLKYSAAELLAIRKGAGGA